MPNWLLLLGVVLAGIIGGGLFLGLAWYWILLASILIPGAIIAYVLYVGYQKIKPKPQTDIPCPPYSHPMLGHPDRMLSPLKHELRLEVCDAARAMFHQLVFMNQSSVFINDAEEAVRVLKKFQSKGDIYKVFRLNPEIPDVLASDGEEAFTRRSLFGPALDSARLESQCLTDLMSWLERAAESKSVIDISEVFSLLAFDIMSSFLFEYDLGALRGSEEGKALLSSIRTLTDAQAKVGIYADPNVRSISPEELRKAQTDWRDYLVKMKSKVMADADECLSKNGVLSTEKFGHALKKLAENRAYTDQHIAADIHQVFRHGYECIAGTFVWIFYALAKHPKIRLKLQNDVAEWTQEGRTGYPEYLECIIKETFRRYPVAGNTTVRTVTDPESELTGGAKVAINTPLHVHMYSLHNTSREWDKPKEFIPERWLEPTGEEAKELSHPRCPFLAGDNNIYNGAGHVENSLSFFPFSVGDRICLGQTLVLKALREVLFNVSARYHLRFVEKVWTEDLGVSQNAVIVPQLAQSKSMRVYRGKEVPKEDQVDEGWADSDDESPNPAE